MLEYRFNVADALERVGFNGYQAKKSGLISQETLKKLKNEDTNINLKSLNAICAILKMPVDSILIYKEDEQEQKNISEKFKK